MVLHLLAKRVYSARNICRIKWICQLAPILAQHFKETEKRTANKSERKKYPVTQVTLTSAESEGWTRKHSRKWKTRIFLIVDLVEECWAKQFTTLTFRLARNRATRNLCMEPLTLCLLRCIMGSLIPSSFSALSDWFKLRAVNERRRKNCLLCERAHAWTVIKSFIDL